MRNMGQSVYIYIANWPASKCECYDYMITNILNDIIDCASPLISLFYTLSCMGDLLQVCSQHLVIHQCGYYSLAIYHHTYRKLCTM